MAFCFYKQQILFLKINALEKGTYLFREKACKNFKKKKKWRLYNDCYTESDKKIAGPRFELGLSGL